MIVQEPSSSAGACPAPEVVREQLRKVLESRAFSASGRMRRFLEFVVEQALSGEAAVKETVVGVHVFDRTPDYDPKSDPIVRVEARRLRAKLEQYYEFDGTHDLAIITLPRGGYVPRFEIRHADPVEAELIAITAEQEVAAAVPETLPAVEAASSRKLFWLLLFLCVAVAAAEAARHIAWRAVSPIQPIDLPPVTTYLGREFDASVSPDSKQVAFVWNRNGANYDIYLKLVDIGSPIRLTTDPAHDLHPAWSPDGRYLAFLRASAQRQQVIVMPALGGSEQVITEILSDVASWRTDPMQMAGRPGPSWTPDGKRLAVTEAIEKGAAFGIFLEPVWSGQRRQITFPRGGANDFYPVFSPDGKTLAFVRYTSNSASDIFVTSADGGAPSQVTHDRRDVRGLSWLADSRTLVFSSNRSGPYGLWLVEARGGEPRLVPTHSANAAEPSVAHEGNWLVYTDSTENTNIWRVAIAKPGHGSPSPEKLIASSRRTHSPQYSPDGARVAFVSDRSGSWEIWISKADGSDPTQLTSFNGPMVGTPHWSPDGRGIAFDARPDGNSAVFVIAPEGGTPRRVNLNKFEERMPSWSHDGKWLYFNSNRDGMVRLWKEPAEGGQPVRLTSTIAYDSAESPDGKLVYFISRGAGIWRVQASGGNEELVPELAQVFPRRYWTVTDTGIYYVEQDQAPRAIRFFSFKTRRSETVAHIDGALMIDTPSLTVSPDGRWLLYAQQDQGSSDIARIGGFH